MATSPIACAISPVALPASSDVEDIWTDADPTVPAAVDTCPISSRRLAIIVENEVPSASRSECAWTDR